MVRIVENDTYDQSACLELKEAHSKINGDYTEIAAYFIAFPKFQEKECSEFVKYGFLRRLSTMRRCIDNIYRICPPERNSILSDEELIDLRINLQCFFINTYGCLDNLAWIFAKAKGIIPKDNREIGFFKNPIKGRLSVSFVARLEKMKEWKEYIESFRHPLAHQVPCYIPPYFIEGSNPEKVFRPVLPNSLTGKILYFHPQVIADWNTIIDLANEFLKEF